MYEVSEENNTYKTVDGVIFSKDGKELVAYPGGKKVLTYTIPEGTQTGTKFTIREKGFKSLNSSAKGNFVFTVVVQTPKRLNKEQRELIEKLAVTMNEQPPVKKRGLFG